MKQTAQIIPSYTGDTSGVCSALYELGGLIVMHDAAGCNATYSAFDEPRWYTQESLVFVSGLTEMEAVLGDDQRLIEDTVAAAQKFQPAFIALVGSPIPTVTAVDFPAIAREIEQLTKIPTMGFNATGMASYVSGAGMAFEGLAKKFVLPQVSKTQAVTVNILGVTPLDFSINGADQALKAVLQAQGLTVQSSWAMGETLSNIKQAAGAKVNLVVSATGLAAAKVLAQKFEIPYVVGLPYGPVLAQQLAKMLIQTSQDHQNRIFCQAVPASDTVIIGESVAALSLAKALATTTDFKATVLCPVDTFPELLTAGCIKARDEAELKPYLQQATTIIADPLYQPICPPKARFIPLPQEAFSGRIYRQAIPELVKGFTTFRRNFGL